MNTWLIVFFVYIGLGGVCFHLLDDCFHGRVRWWLSEAPDSIALGVAGLLWPITVVLLVSSRYMRTGA